MTERQTLPAGLLLPSGLYLTHEPHRECECAGCAEAWAAYDAGQLTINDDDEEELPW